MMVASLCNCFYLLAVLDGRSFSSCWQRLHGKYHALMMSSLTLSMIRVVVYRIPKQSKAISNGGTRYVRHHKFLKQPRGITKFLLAGP
jgi:hypothetical protein